MQDINPNQLNFKVSDSYEKDEKITTSFQPSNDEYVMNKACLNEKLSKIQDHLSFLEKDKNEFEILSDKQSVEEVLIQRIV